MSVPRRARNEPRSLSEVAPARFRTILRGTSNPDLWAEGLALLTKDLWLVEPMLANGRIDRDLHGAFVESLRELGAQQYVVRRLARSARLDPAVLRRLWSFGTDWQAELCERSDCPADLLDALLAAPAIPLQGSADTVQMRALRYAPFSPERLGQILDEAVQPDWVKILRGHRRIPVAALRRHFRTGRARMSSSEARDLMAHGPPRGDARMVVYLARAMWETDLLEMLRRLTLAPVTHLRLLLRAYQQRTAARHLTTRGSDLVPTWRHVAGRPDVDLAWPEVRHLWAILVTLDAEAARDWLALNETLVPEGVRADYRLLLWVPALTSDRADDRVTAVAGMGAGRRG